MDKIVNKTIERVTSFGCVCNLNTDGQIISHKHSVKTVGINGQINETVQNFIGCSKCEVAFTHSKITDTAFEICVCTSNKKMVSKVVTAWESNYKEIYYFARETRQWEPCNSMLCK